MISLIEREVVDNKRWIKREEFLDLLAVSQALPGVLAINIAVAVGDHLRGMKGSVAAALGTIAPCFAIILTIAVFLSGHKQFKSLPVLCVPSPENSLKTKQTDK